MRFRHPKADLFIPDQTDPDKALARVTHLGIVSHQDDLEIAHITASPNVSAMKMHGSVAWW